MPAVLKSGIKTSHHLSPEHLKPETLKPGNISLYRSPMRKRIITFSLLAAGVILIIVGIALKQPDSVFAKAAKICMECVGIG